MRVLRSASSQLAITSLAILGIGACSSSGTNDPGTSDPNNTFMPGTAGTPATQPATTMGGAGAVVTPPATTGGAGTVATPPAGTAGANAVVTPPAGAGGMTTMPPAGTAGMDAVGTGGMPVVTPPAGMEGVLGHPDGTITYPEYTGFTLAMAEEFNTPIDFATDDLWAWSDGGLDEGIVRFVPEGIAFTAQGTMTITMAPGTVAGSFSHAEEKDVSTKQYTSGEMRTKYQNFRYGRYEARWKVPTIGGDVNATGGYVSTLFVFRNPKFTQWREIDIEMTGDSTSTFSYNLVNGDGKYGWEGAIQEAGAVNIAFNPREDYHVYGFEWTPEAVRWYIDDNMVLENTAADGGLPIPDLSAKIMMNLWAGAFGGDPAPNTYPLVAEYDWVRFYKWDQEEFYPCTPTPTCLPAGDLDGAKNNPDDGVPDIDPDVP